MLFNPDSHMRQTRIYCHTVWARKHRWIWNRNPETLRSFDENITSLKWIALVTLVTLNLVFFLCKRKRKAPMSLKGRLCSDSGDVMFWMHIPSEKHVAQIGTEWGRARRRLCSRWVSYWYLAYDIDFHRLGMSKKVSLPYQPIWLAS